MKKQKSNNKQGGNIMDDLKEKLYKSIENNGPTHPVTIKLSQELDQYMVTEQRQYYGRN